MAHLPVKTCWMTFGPTDGPLTSEVHALLQGLKGRPELNGELVQLLSWDGQAERFAVAVKSTGERILVRSVNLRAEKHCIDLSLCFASESHLWSLDMDLEMAVAAFLRPRTVGALSAVSRALRAALWLRPDADGLWQSFAVQTFGPKVLDIVKRITPPAAGTSLYRRARGLKNVFRQTVEIVQGGVHTTAEGFEVVACPCLYDPTVAPPVGAQAAVRHAAGRELEEAIRNMDERLPELGVKLVPGGNLSKRVALVVTAPPNYLFESQGRATLEGVIQWTTQMHSNLLKEVRDAGHRSLAMPTLATGGVGVPPHLVAIGALQAIHSDLMHYPSDPIRIRISCYEVSHIPSFNSVKDDFLNHFYRPEQAMESWMSILLDANAQRDDA